MVKKLLSIYMTLREPKVFFVIVSAFITISLTAHWMRSYDTDLGLTNLVLSVEATLYGIVQGIMLRALQKKQDAAAEIQQQQLEALVAMAEAARQTQLDHLNILRELRKGDEALLLALQGQK